MIIESEEQFNEALARLMRLRWSLPGTEEYNEMLLLSDLVEQYDRACYRIEAPTEKEALDFRKEQDK